MSTFLHLARVRFNKYKHIIQLYDILSNLLSFALQWPYHYKLLSLSDYFQMKNADASHRTNFQINEADKNSEFSFGLSKQPDTQGCPKCSSIWLNVFRYLLCKAKRCAIWTVASRCRRHVAITVVLLRRCLAGTCNSSVHIMALLGSFC